MSTPINPEVVKRPLVMCGPSGTGKSTLLKRLFAAHPNKFGFSISHTTRQPRGGEENGREYHFVTEEEFMKRVGEGEFLEWAKFGGNCYGTTFAALSALNPLRCILDIELQGVLQLRARAASHGLSPVYLFLSPPSAATLRQRLDGRGTETADSIKKRLEAAKRELEYAISSKGQEGEGFEVVIVNDEVERAGDELEKVAMGYEGWEKAGDSLPDFDLKELELEPKA